MMLGQSDDPLSDLHEPFPSIPDIVSFRENGDGGMLDPGFSDIGFPPGVTIPLQDIVAVVSGPEEAAGIVLHTGAAEILAGADAYYGTPEGQAAAEMALADLAATRDAGGDVGGRLARWGQQLGQAFINAVPSLLNRIIQNPQTRQYEVRAQPSGIGTLPWGWIVGGVVAVMVLPKLLRGGSRGGRRRARARRR